MVNLLAAKGFGYPFNIPLKALQSLTLDPLTTKFLGFLPIIAFIALLMAAVWRQAKRHPVKILVDSNQSNSRNF